MKHIFAVILFALSLSAIASDNSDSQTITLSQDQRLSAIHLESDEYKDIFEFRYVDSYCERQVWNDRCTRDSNGWNCTGGTCSTNTYPECYSTERYSCVKEEYVFVRKEFVKTHKHNVEIKLSPDLKLMDKILDLEIKAVNQNILVKLKNSYTNHVIAFEMAQSGENTQIVIEPIMTKALAENFKSTSIQNLSFKNGDISFEIKEGAKLKDFIKVSYIQIEKKRLFSDLVIYQTPYKQFEKGGEILASNNDLRVLFTCTNSKIPCVKEGKHDVFIEAEMNLNDKVLNISEFAYLKKEMTAELLKVKP